MGFTMKDLNQEIIKFDYEKISKMRISIFQKQSTYFKIDKYLAKMEKNF